MIKKIKIKNIVLLLSLLMMTGCDFMDCDESDNFTKQEVLDSYNRVKQLATNVYGFLKADFCSIDGAMLDAATDDAVHIYKSSNIQRFVDGTWSANNLVDNVWGHYYKGIRAANFYLKETAGLTFDEWKYSDDYEAIMKEFTNYQYEVRFLRAYFYFELIKRYRNINFVIHQGFPQFLKVPTDDIDFDIRMLFTKCMQGVRQKVFGTLCFDDTEYDGAVFSKFGITGFLYGSFP